MTNRQLARVLRILTDNQNHWPLPAVSLLPALHQSPFRVLVSTVLSLRTKDAVTIEASNRLFAEADSPARLLSLSKKRVARLIYPVGFYNVKAAQLHDISRSLIERFDGNVPDTLEDLLTLKGVGRKTANLVLILGYGQPAICVDTHVHRISNRWNYVRTRTPNESELELRKTLPRRYWMSYNNLLVSFGQNICRPVTPMCSRCPVRPLCPRRGVTRHR